MSMLYEDIPVGWEGDGSKDNPYKINNVGDLVLLQEEVAKGTAFGEKFFLQTDNLDLSTATIKKSTDNSWLPIGTQHNPFSATYDGGIKSIANLKILDATSSYYGLFGYIGAKGCVKNVIIQSGKISILEGDTHASGIAGTNTGTVQSCYANVTIEECPSNSIIGFVVGFNSGTISDCFCNGEITHKNNGDSKDAFIGGIAGKNTGSIEGCYNRGKISVGGTGAYTGGITNNTAGVLSSGTVRNCYNLGDIEGCDGNTGGIVGTSVVTSEGEAVLNCYYWDKSVKSNNYGTQLTLEKMTDSKFLKDINNNILHFSAPLTSPGKKMIFTPYLSAFTDKGLDEIILYSTAAAYLKKFELVGLSEYDNKNTPVFLKWSSYNSDECTLKIGQTETSVHPEIDSYHTDIGDAKPASLVITLHDKYLTNPASLTQSYTNTTTIEKFTVTLVWKSEKCKLDLLKEDGFLELDYIKDERQTQHINVMVAPHWPPPQPKSYLVCEWSGTGVDKYELFIDDKSIGLFDSTVTRYEIQTSATAATLYAFDENKYAAASKSANT